MMKKIIALSTILSLALGMVTPVLALDTYLVRDPGSGAIPIVKAKWEMNVAKDTGGKYLGTDDATTAGAQFNAPGVYKTTKTIAVCGIVTDPDGLADVDGVYADVFYPEDIELGTSHEPLPGQSGLGCGGLMQEDTLHKLTKADGIELFCNKIRTSNTNLPTFNTSPVTYTYDEICKADGELMKETAGVYCAEKDLSYEDPSGNYKVVVMAQDKNGLSGTLENYFKYLDLTAFDVDFNSVSYGSVKLNTHKIINGDLTWDVSPGANPATVRNVGNTKLSMWVKQDDMDLGMTDGVYNVKYDGRVGSDAAWVNYIPEQTKKLKDPLDLSEMNEMDFSIDITKFPFPPQSNYDGTMTLTATKETHLPCGG